jgi:release factor glutamine methyltransferase
MTIHDILNQAVHDFETAGIPSARLDAEVLLSFYLQCDRLEFLKNPAMEINDSQVTGFRNIVSRRIKWEPVAYITGRKEFWSLLLEVNKEVLIPRPDTEVLVEETLKICRQTDSPEINILDIGTGSGAIVIALASELPQAKFTATDISEAALNLARGNANRSGFGKRIDFRKGDLFEPVDSLFDVIVSNPPYISAQDYENLPAGVRDYEPPEALLAGKTGWEFYAKLIYQAPEYLQKNGWLLMEIGAKQEKPVRELLDGSGFFDSINMRRDYAGLPRVIKARRNSSG